jgi:hypothetical protein
MEKKPIKKSAIKFRHKIEMAERRKMEKARLAPC